MITVVVTNTTNAALEIQDLYTTLGASGASDASVTFTASVAQIDSMTGLKQALNAGQVTVTLTASSDNVDFLSIPIEQHGKIASVATTSVAIVNTALTFPKAFAAAPTVFVTLDKTNMGAAVVDGAWVDTVTASGCNVKVNVTTAATSTSVAVNWMAVY